MNPIQQKIVDILKTHNIEDENLANALADIYLDIVKQIPSIADIDRGLAENMERYNRGRLF